MTTLVDYKLSVLEFKNRYTRIYNKIINLYGGRSNIFDMQAAINLWLRSEPHPKCEICDSLLVITKTYRSQASKAYRCRMHINTNTLINSTEITQILRNGITVYQGKIPDKITATTKVELFCERHGRYTQTAGYILSGGQCQKCYHESRKPRMSTVDWIKIASKVHGSIYDYSNSNYNGIDTNIIIKCPTHGEFVQNAGVHLRGHSCKKCAIDRLTINSRIDPEEYIKKCIKKHGDVYDYSQTEYVSILHGKVKIICKKHGEFMQRPGDHLNGGCGCAKCARELTTYKSAAEYEIIEFLKEHITTQIEHSWHGFGSEIDIYLPDYKLAIEYNGVYWHSSEAKDTDKKFEKQHLLKTEMCEKNGVSLLHILDVEWNDPIKKEIWKSTILHKLGLSAVKFYARKCSTVLVSALVAKKFFIENHLQGAAASAINIGLQYDNKLVAVGAFAKSRFRKDDNTYELIRFASLRGTSVVGGFQKIIKEFAKTHSGTLISYANRRWSRGNVYDKSNFILDLVSSPCYYYTNCKELWHRTVFQKHKLKDSLENFDINLTEVENMYNHKYRRIWDCGHFVYKITL